MRGWHSAESASHMCTFLLISVINRSKETRVAETRRTRPGERIGVGWGGGGGDPTSGSVER